MTKKKPLAPNRTPNEEQKSVINFEQGCACVMAGPGSGKSFTLVERYARLISEGAKPDSILSLSFTQTAAKSLQKRVEDKVGKLEFTRTAGARTFHSISLAFSQQERHEFDFELAEFPLATEPVAYKLSGEAARRYEIDPRTLRPAISLFKRGRVSSNQAVKEAENSLKAGPVKLALAYKEYDKKCREAGLLDFDSLMYQMVEILSKKKAVRDRWQYEYVMADESQDNCITDWQLLKLLTEKYGNLLCVGDPGQSVFGFRGADPKMFLNMDQTFPGTKKLYLAANYRSTPELVSFLKGIGPVPELAALFHTSNPTGPDPVVKGFTNGADEAKWVTDQIKELV